MMTPPMSQTGKKIPVNNQQQQTPISRRNPGTGKESGFTLVELMIALLLGVFLLGGVTLTYLAGRAAYQEGQELSRIQENLRFASDFLVRDIRLAGFRDDLALTIAEQNAIRDKIAKIESGKLVIRYAGRHHCAESRADVTAAFSVIENRYYVENEELKCEGQRVVVEPTETGWTETMVPSPPIALTRGVSGLSFMLLDKDGKEQSNSDLSICSFGNGCLGVKVNLKFEAFDADRSVDLQVAFRNNVLDRIYDR